MNDPLAVVHKEPQDQNKVPHTLHQKIISVAELLSVTSLTIPEYQRPYKWDKSNLASLFNDIKTQCDKPAYRLGTIVLHKPKDKDDKDVLNVVDGQQRTLTLMLTVLAIAESYKDKTSDEAIKAHEYLGDLPKKVAMFAHNQKFVSDISQYNLHQNYQEITRIISRGELTPSHIKFLLQQCQVVVFVLNDESEAFQFFDSQNSRGKDLNPHDLLKAFHLREFDTHNQTLKAKTVAYWEGLGDEKLAKLFAEHLFRIKHWSQSKPARSFTKHQIDLFKGINLDKVTLPPHAQSLLITHNFIDDYNASPHRHVDKQAMSYPFQLDQTIINGQRFFERVKHYHSLIDQVKEATIYDASHRVLKNGNCTAFMDADNSCCSVTLCNQTLNRRASAIIHTLNTYSERHRQGDVYTRNLFDNALIYYIDKFGTQDLSEAIEMIFIWAYQVRLTEYAVRLASTDNHAKASAGLFRHIQQAILPKDILVKSIPSLKINQINSNNRADAKDIEYNNKNKIYKLFKHLNYLV